MIEGCSHDDVFVFETGTGKSFAACLSCDPVRVWKVVRVSIPELTEKLRDPNDATGLLVPDAPEGA